MLGLILGFGFMWFKIITDTSQIHTNTGFVEQGKNSSFSRSFHILLLCTCQKSQLKQHQSHPRLKLRPKWLIRQGLPEEKGGRPNDPDEEQQLGQLLGGGDGGYNHHDTSGSIKPEKNHTKIRKPQSRLVLFKNRSIKPAYCPLKLMCSTPDSWKPPIRNTCRIQLQMRTIHMRSLSHFWWITSFKIQKIAIYCHSWQHQKLSKTQTHMVLQIKRLFGASQPAIYCHILPLQIIASVSNAFFSLLPNQPNRTKPDLQRPVQRFDPMGDHRLWTRVDLVPSLDEMGDLQHDKEEHPWKSGVEIVEIRVLTYCFF